MNQAEATIIGLQIRAQAIQTNVTSMLAHDMAAESNGTTLYSEQSYLNRADELFEIGTEILRLSALLQPTEQMVVQTVVGQSPTHPNVASLCGYDDKTGNCTRVNCCKQAQPERKKPKCLTCKCWSIDKNGNCDYCGTPYTDVASIQKQAQPVLRVIPTAQGVFPVWFDGAWRKSVYKYGTDYGTGIALYAAPIPQQPKAEPVLQVVNGELCYKSTEDDQSFGMWCPVTPDYHPPFKNGSGFYAAPIPQQPSVPEGWKLVPIEPTEAMLEVGFFAENDVFDSAKTKRIHVWKDMIAAAPQPKETK